MAISKREGKSKTKKIIETIFCQSGKFTIILLSLKDFLPLILTQFTSDVLSSYPHLPYGQFSLIYGFISTIRRRNSGRLRK
jgi:hypothetical protein